MKSLEGIYLKLKKLVPIQQSGWKSVLVYVFDDHIFLRAFVLLIFLSILIEAERPGKKINQAMFSLRE